MYWNLNRTHTRIGLDIHRDRNLELLKTIFVDSEVFEFSGDVPTRTDLCIIDEVALRRAPDRFSDWHTQQSPLFAPVVLLSETTTPNPWETFEETLLTHIDSIFQIPVSKAEFSSRVDKLLQMRDISRELDEQKQLAEQIFETSPMAKFVFDSERTVVRANKRAGELAGVDYTELVGQAYNTDGWTAVGEDGVEIHESELPLSQVFQTGCPIYGYEHLIRRNGAGELWVSVNMAPIRDESGDIHYVVATVEDITVRRSQAMELERQVDLFRQAEHIADVGAWEYHVPTDEFWVSREVTRIYGHPDDSQPIVGKSLHYYHPDDRASISTAFTRAIEEGESFELELRIVRDDGEQRWIQTRGEPHVENGRTVRIRGIIQDITTRKERELEIEKMRNAVEKSPIGITLSDPTQDDNPLIYVNEGFEALTDYAPEQVIGRNCRFLQGENTNPETVAKIRRAIDLESPVAVDIRNYRADGSMFWNHLEIAPIHGADGELLNYIGFQQDVTQRVESRKQLDVIDRYLRHNLRNRLNVVEGMADMIRSDSEPPLTEYADSIIDAASALLDTMEKERQVTQILQRDSDIGPVALMVDLTDRIETIRREYPDASISVDGPDEVTVDAIPELPLAIEEVVRNAVEHAKSPAPTVAVTVSEQDDDVVVRIVDDGPGLPDMEVDVLSTPELESSVYHGQGLGLWMVSLIVSRSRGEIRFEKGSPTGTAVTICVSSATPK